MEKILVNAIYEDGNISPWSSFKSYNEEVREAGRDWPEKAFSMIGLKRMKNLRDCCEKAIWNSIPGDFVETGIWRGGALMMMAAVVEAYKEDNSLPRVVWGFDSFKGLPEPESKNDKGDIHHTYKELAISKEQVIRNFEKIDYQLLHNTILVEGWFKDTIPQSNVVAISVLRLDGDMYDSTEISLTHLYPKLSKGGYCIIDDFNLPGARAAVQDYLTRNGLNPEIKQIDGMGAYWRK